MLLNGRRAADYTASGGAVNLNFIPVAAIERVDEGWRLGDLWRRRDGRSGRRRSCRKDFRGAQISAYDAQPQQDGGNQSQLNLTLGYGNLATDRINAFVTASYQKDNVLLTMGIFTPPPIVPR